MGLSTSGRPGDLLGSQFAADITTLLRRHRVPCSTPADLEDLGLHLQNNSGLRADLFQLCSAISRMYEEDMSAADLLYLVAQTFYRGGSGRGGHVDIPESLRLQFASAYTAWNSRDLATAEYPRAATPQDHAPGGYEPEPDSLASAIPAPAAQFPPPAVETLERLSLGSLELKMYLDDIERRMNHMEPHLAQMVSLIKSSAALLDKLDTRPESHAASPLPLPVVLPAALPAAPQTATPQPATPQPATPQTATQTAPQPAAQIPAQVPVQIATELRPSQPGPSPSTAPAVLSQAVPVPAVPLSAVPVPQAEPPQTLSLTQPAAAQPLSLSVPAVSTSPQALTRLEPSPAAALSPSPAVPTPAVVRRLRLTVATLALILVLVLASGAWFARRYLYLPARAAATSPAAASPASTSTAALPAALPPAATTAASSRAHSKPSAQAAPPLAHPPPPSEWATPDNFAALLKTYVREPASPEKPAPANSTSTERGSNASSPVPASPQPSAAEARPTPAAESGRETPRETAQPAPQPTSQPAKQPESSAPTPVAAHPTPNRSEEPGLAAATGPRNPPSAPTAGPETRAENRPAPVTRPAPIVRVETPQPGPIVVPSSIMIRFATSSPKPRYPVALLSPEKEGRVEVQAIISRGGRVVSTRVLNGPISFRDAAAAAMRDWRFRPYVVDGAPREVSTSVVFLFKPPSF